MMTVHQSNETVLRRALIGNAVFSAASALPLIFAADAVARYLFAVEFTVLGIGEAGILLETGLLVAVFAVLVATVASRSILSRTAVKLVIGADIAWVLGSIALLALANSVLSPLGSWLVVAVAVAVATFAAGQSIGLALLYQGESEITVSHTGDRVSIDAAILAHVPPERAWEVMRDQEAYADIADNLSRVEIVEGEGRGMIRRCTDRSGKSWRETCTLWDDGRAFAFQVHTEAPDYPYPIAELSGTWSIAPTQDGTRIEMSFDLRAKRGVHNRLLLTIMRASFATVCDRLLRRWTERMEDRAAGASLPSHGPKRLPQPAA